MTGRTRISFLNLCGSGLSLLERLSLEEALLRHDSLQRSWAIVGYHDPIRGTPSRIRPVIESSLEFSDRRYYPGCAIVLGLGGKPDQLVNLPKAKEDNVMMIKRFSGGGTVVVDQDSLLTTFIGRNKHFPDLKPFPRDIMDWSLQFFNPAFDSMNKLVNSKDSSGGRRNTLAMQGNSCGLNDIKSNITNVEFKRIPNFFLRENDYVLGSKKMGGNAQSIVKGGFLHHTSFLWDYVDDHMEYLTLPSKRPKYRGNRSHNDFLVKLSSYYEGLNKKVFFDQLREATLNSLEIEEVQLEDALYVVEDKFGSLQQWFEGECRTRIIDYEQIQ